MHVDDVEATTASMIAELRAEGRHRAWMLLGSTCQNDYVVREVGAGEVLAG